MPSDFQATHRWLIDIQHHIALAEHFVAGMSYEAFTDSTLHLYAVTRCLEIISEASRRLPDALKERHPSIGWQNWLLPVTSTATSMRMWRQALYGALSRRACRCYARSSARN